MWVGMLDCDLQFTATGNLAMTDAAGQPPADNQKQSFRIMAQTPFQATLPDRQTADPQLFKLGLVTGITRTIAGNLGLPEVGSGRWEFEEMAVMSVPETTIHLDHRTVARKPKVRLTRQGSIVQTVAKSGMMQQLANLYLRLGIGILNPGHKPASGLWIHYVRHTDTRLKAND